MGFGDFKGKALENSGYGVKSNGLEVRSEGLGVTCYDQDTFEVFSREIISLLLPSIGYSSSCPVP